MRELFSRVRLGAGGFTPVSRGRRATIAVASLLALVAIGCGESDEKRTLQPIQLGMTKELQPVYEADQMVIYEVKRPVSFNILTPDDGQLQELQAQPTPPYPRLPWLQRGDTKVQITWTLSNIDPETHDVEVLIDPWNEFARYWPGMSVTNAQREEQRPNLSGIDFMYELPGLDDSRSSRRHGTITFEDMDELAIDFATVMNIIATAPPPDPTLDASENAAVGLVNRAFHTQNRSWDDPIIQPYIPGVIAGLTGIDLGIRTYEPANVAIEIVVEIIDKGSGKVLQRDETGTTFLEPEEMLTIGNGGG